MHLNPFLLQFSDILLEVLDILSVLLFLLLQALSVVVKLLLLVLFLFCLGSSVSDFDFEFRDGLALLVDLVGDFVVVLLKITVLGFVNGKLFQLFLVKLFELIELILLLTKNAVFFELVLHGGLLLELLDLLRDQVGCEVRTRAGGDGGRGVRCENWEGSWHRNARRAPPCGARARRRQPDPRLRRARRRPPARRLHGLSAHASAELQRAARGDDRGHALRASPSRRRARADERGTSPRGRPRRP